ncbi:MAG: hypothetical protein J0G95_13695 [Rhizobiales bacterium]|nr:hypothetical protein [Hyphomicrobiales bacterium]
MALPLPGLTAFFHFNMSQNRGAQQRLVIDEARQQFKGLVAFAIYLKTIPVAQVIKRSQIGLGKFIQETLVQMQELGLPGSTCQKSCRYRVGVIN